MNESVYFYNLQMKWRCVICQKSQSSNGIRPGSEHMSHALYHYKCLYVLVIEFSIKGLLDGLRVLHEQHCVPNRIGNRTECLNLIPSSIKEFLEVQLLKIMSKLIMFMILVQSKLNNLCKMFVQPQKVLKLLLPLLYIPAEGIPLHKAFLSHTFISVASLKNYGPFECTHL